MNWFTSCRRHPVGLLHLGLACAVWSVLLCTACDDTGPTILWTIIDQKTNSSAIAIGGTQIAPGRVNTPTFDPFAVICHAANDTAMVSSMTLDGQGTIGCLVDAEYANHPVELTPALPQQASSLAPFPSENYLQTFVDLSSYARPKSLQGPCIEARGSLTLTCTARNGYNAKTTSSTLDVSFQTPARH
jgi:hypothetical protein